jgi:uncharacterized protein (DUF2252 family)
MTDYQSSVHTKGQNQSTGSVETFIWKNFGQLQGDNRLVYFDLNDSDEAVLAPVSSVGIEDLSLPSGYLRDIFGVYR